jgi:nucleolysin TIA-1/TIAR
MTPQGGPPSAASAHPMSGYPSSHQSPMSGTSPGRYGNQPPGGFGGPGMPPQGYQMPGQGGMPGSAGGYGRDQGSAGGYGGPPSAGGYPPSNMPNSGYGGYQG